MFIKRHHCKSVFTLDLFGFFDSMYVCAYLCVLVIMCVHTCVRVCDNVCGVCVLVIMCVVCACVRVECLI